MPDRPGRLKFKETGMTIANLAPRAQVVQIVNQPTKPKPTRRAVEKRRAANWPSAAPCGR
jgi:hypothetical protein